MSVDENYGSVTAVRHDHAADLFQVVGIREESSGKNETGYSKRRVLGKGFPIVSLAFLVLILTGCIFADMICSKDPAYLDLMNYSKAPNREFWFGTDTLGRDLFACIWHGGRISLLIGFLASMISLLIAALYGTVSGLASDFVDTVMMRFTEIFLSIPSLLIVIFLQGILGKAGVLSLSITIGVTSWCSIAKVVRTEVRQLRKSEFIQASRCMGGGFLHILCVHLAPNFFPSIMFMTVMNVRAAIVAESTLSFMGIGLPIETISWGSLLSLSEKALMTRAWWIILIPGIFLVMLLVSITSLAHWAADH